MAQKMLTQDMTKRQEYRLKAQGRVVFKHKDREVVRTFLRSYNDDGSTRCWRALTNGPICGVVTL